MSKRRLDQELVRRGLAESRSRAQQLIGAGAVLVDGQVAAKPALAVSPETEVALSGGLPYVGRGGVKLAAALDAFGIRVAGLVALDVGASTGGFTDCLLQAGAARVYAVDVGHGQMAETLRSDPRVVAMEGQDIRQVTSLPEPVDLAVVDVSFISLRLVLPAVAPLLARQGTVVALIKPQFEAGPGAVDRRGVIRDDRVRRRAVEGVLGWAEEQGWEVLGLAPSPITGGDGNVEYLACLRRRASPV